MSLVFEECGCPHLLLPSVLRHLTHRQVAGVCTSGVCLSHVYICGFRELEVQRAGSTCWECVVGPKASSKSWPAKWCEHSAVVISQQARDRKDLLPKEYDSSGYC
jgi:hypothetical protein